MSVHKMTKDKHGVPRWEVVIRFKAKNGKKRRSFVRRGTKAEAKTWEAWKKTELENDADRAAQAPPPVVPRFSDFCVDQYRPNAELTLKADSWAKRRSHLATLMEFFGDRRLDEIGEVVDDYKRKRRLRPGRVKKVSLNNELRVLRRILHFARDERHIDFVVPKITFFKLGTRRPKVWTEQQVMTLFKACAKTSPSLLPMLVFLVNTGARRGEALALTWDRIDLDRRLVLIYPTEDPDEDDQDDDDEPDEGWEPKNKQPREVPISDHLVPWLEAKRISPTWLFPSANTGERYAYWPEKQFQRAQKLAGLRGGVHTLRHTYASHFLRAEPDFFLLGSILGHSQSRVTELYSHLLPDHLERGRNAVQIAPPISPAIAAARKQWQTADVWRSKKPNLSRSRRRRQR